MRTLKDKLSHLTYSQAVNLLGPQGKDAPDVHESAGVVDRLQGIHGRV
ncbi:MAG: hypothetical protein V2B19_17635 [Pseudomonadota bacterium]